MTFIPRLLEKQVREYLSLFPAVSITGPRQSGKSTFLKETFGDRYQYVTFDDPKVFHFLEEDPDGDRLNYVWDFGDSTTAEGPVTSHTYTKGGSYNVTVTVDDGSGTECASSTSGFVASANSAPVPVIKVK